MSTFCCVVMVDWDLVLIALLAEDEERQIRTANLTNRQLWVHNLWRTRSTNGEFSNLFNDLRYDIRKFYDYYRMDYEKLSDLLKSHIKKIKTNFRSPIPVTERLSVCLRKKKIEKKREVRFWIHPILEKREEYGAFHTLVKNQLREDEDKFYNYFRMQKTTFDNLLQKLSQELKHQDTFMRESISPAERLAVTLSAAYIIIRKTIAKRKKKRWWVREYLQQRESSSLLSSLRMRDGSFENFTKMSRTDFEVLLNMVGPAIVKQDTKFRKSNHPHIRLAVTLRYLATGDSYGSLSYTFRVPPPQPALVIRNHFAEYFSSAQGSVPWQTNQA
ncbi:hypothetical protein HW555_008181 [Spodoptera exigua]|uniref:Uncharacterized protein n=1 Tax=Spodoptera exigua TaxID=7107 RepID=A0A835GBN1_SPOEX|nr:hypothetical protein HW555_008181 [Spodoptera exigua]